MYDPVLLRDRPRPQQVVIGGVFPAIAGVIAGVLIGVSPGVYYGFGAVAAVATVIGGFEHQDGWGGADRGVVGGFIYGVVLLVTHAIVGTEATVSLGSFPPFLVVITAILGMLLAGLGGRIARGQRERAKAQSPVAAADVTLEGD
jgi:hypothetical protein